MDITHIFTLTLTGADEITGSIEDALFLAGCDDATLSSRAGVLRLAFDRVATSRDGAIASAIGNVQMAGVGLEVLSVE